MAFGKEKEALELSVLGGLLKSSRKKSDQNCAAELVPALSDWEWESQQAAWLYQQIRESWERHREVPSLSVIMDRIPDGKRGEPDDRYLKVLHDSWEDSSSPRAAFSQLESNELKLRLKARSEKLLDGIDEGKGDEELLTLAASMTQSQLVSKKASSLDWFTSAETRIRGYSDKIPEAERVPRFSTGLNTVNAWAGGSGIPIRGRLVMLLANTNVGKSTFITFLNYNALISFPTLHFIDIRTEELEEDTLARYDSLALQLSRSAISGRGLSEEEIVRALSRLEHLKSLANRLRIVTVPIGTAIPTVTAHIERYRAEIGPDVPMAISIDSPDHLKSGIPRLDPRHDVSNVWMTMKGWTTTKPLGCPSVIASTQAKQETAGKPLSVEDGSESYDKGRTCDLALGLWEDGDAPRNARNNLPHVPINLGVLKNRLSKFKHGSILLRAINDVSRFEEEPRSQRTGGFKGGRQ